MNTQETKKQKAKPSFTEWLAKFEAETGYGIQHGDYQRIASLTRGPGGKPYTSDYVRKVMMDLRTNPDIAKVAKTYLRRQAKIHRDLSQGEG